MTYDVVVIGGGPGGYVAAIRSAQLGGKIAVVEKDRLGGTCLNRGCIPTKALLATVDKLRCIKEAAEFGIEVGIPRVDFQKVQNRKNRIVERLSNGIIYLLSKNKIDLISGKAKIKNSKQVEVISKDRIQSLNCKNIIIATGSKPALIKSLGYNGESIITSEEALKIKEIPKELLIVGAGVIGCEFATIFSSMGTHVTLVESFPNVLPMLDKEISRHLQNVLKDKNISIKTGINIKEIRETENGVEAVILGKQNILAEKALISIGRQLNTDNLELENIGVKLGTRGEVIVDEKMETNVAGIYAVGDITNKQQLAHVASAQGVVAAENIMGKEVKMDYSAVPSCIFTAPEVACVGITTKEAKEKNIPINTGKFNFAANGKALSMEEGEGFVKVLAHKITDIILGVSIIGPHASDLIAEATVAIRNKLTVDELAKTIHAHPTLAESLAEAAEAVHGLSIHS